MKMAIADLFPEPGHVQRLYCGDCEKLMDLVFVDFQAEVTGVHIKVEGLPFLQCSQCNREYWPERSRISVIKLHERAFKSNSNKIQIKRNKITESFGFTSIPFDYDPDDYFYIPGLYRARNTGFLAPVFFKRAVLLKYDTRPDYRLKFVSKTYGSIINDTKGFEIPFGINRNNLAVMWLGDIANLPEAEQYYLKSENVASDHCIASEFYEGQLECVFTERSSEDTLFKVRSEFIEAVFSKHSRQIAQLGEEVLSRALDFNEPIIETAKERRHISSTLNEIHVESLNAKNLKALAKEAGVQNIKGLRGLKLMQKWLEACFPEENTQQLMLPFFVLYDMRLANSHMNSRETKEARTRSILERLELALETDFIETYCRVRDQLITSYKTLTKLISS